MCRTPLYKRSLSALVATLARRFGLLLPSHGRLLVKLLFAEIAENVVLLALSFEAFECAFERFVLAYSYYGHIYTSFPIGQNICTAATVVGRQLIYFIKCLNPCQRKKRGFLILFRKKPDSTF